MFKERDRRWAAVQFMLSNDPSYDNRTIASTLRMQIWIATNNRDVPGVMKTMFPATGMVFDVVSSESHIMPPHIFEVSLKVNTKVYLNFLTPWSDLNFPTPWSDLNWIFFNIFQILSPSLLGMTSYTLQSHSQSGVYYDNSDPIYPTPQLGQDMTQGQFLKRSLAGLNSEFSFS